MLNHFTGAPNVSAAGLMVTDVGETHATLEWTLNYTPNNKPESFVVTCVPDEASPHTNTINVTVQLEELSEYTNTTQQTNFTYQITGLQQNTDYTCFLTARNIFGDGHPSHSISIMTNSAGIYLYKEHIPLIKALTSFLDVAWGSTSRCVVLQYQLFLETKRLQLYTHTAIKLPCHTMPCYDLDMFDAQLSA